jgi:hypothetical protein
LASGQRPTTLSCANPAARGAGSLFGPVNLGAASRVFNWPLHPLSSSKVNIDEMNLTGMRAGTEGAMGSPDVVRTTETAHQSTFEGGVACRDPSLPLLSPYSYLVSWPPTKPATGLSVLAIIGSKSCCLCIIRTLAVRCALFVDSAHVDFMPACSPHQTHQYQVANGLAGEAKLMQR